MSTDRANAEYETAAPSLLSSRHVVHVFDRDGRILAMLLTIPTIRPTAADDTRMTFEERRAGAPFPKWFYPGNLSGEEFIYRTHTN
jgi:hypothetical protein